MKRRLDALRVAVQPRHLCVGFTAVVSRATGTLSPDAIEADAAGLRIARADAAAAGDTSLGSVSLGTALGLVVSVAALVSTVIVGWLRFRHERALADRADARTILAEGALELGRMKGVMKDTLTKLENALKGEGPWPPDTNEQIHAMEVAEEALESALAAVRIRFAHDDEIVIRLEGAHDAARSALVTYWTAAGSEPDDDHADYADALKFGAFFDSCKDSYLVVAQKAVGAKLTKTGRSY